MVENVYIQSPTGGTYTITVNGFQVSQDQEPDLGGTNQDFSLVWSGAFGPAPTLQSIDVTPTTASIHEDQTQQYNRDGQLQRLQHPGPHQLGDLE